MSANAIANAENNILDISNNSVGQTSSNNNYINTKPLILIPAYNPGEALLQLVDGLHELGFQEMLIVDDGSDEQSQEIFNRLKSLPYCTIEKHEKNKGKGAALKTGLKKFLTDYPNHDFVITSNADGQHSLEAIKTVANNMEKNPKSLILGIGDFTKFNLPLRNKIFKVITQKLLSFFMSQDIVDIQTGLRGIPRYLAARFQNLSGDSYDYESNMIFECQKEVLPIVQVPIKISFIKKRRDGNYHPVLDALKLYWQFIKYIMVSLITTAIDVFGFMVFVYMFRDASPNNYILYATVVSRVIALLCTYAINNRTVFRSHTNKSQTFWRYTLLCIVNIFLSAYLVEWVFWLSEEKMNLAVIKLLISFGLFFFNYVLQKKWVFKNKVKTIK